MARVENLEELVSATRAFEWDPQEDTSALQQFLDSAALDAGERQADEYEDTVSFDAGLFTILGDIHMRDFVALTSDLISSCVEVHGDLRVVLNLMDQYVAGLPLITAD